MNKTIYTLLLTFFGATFFYGQDTTRNISHEIGFNTVSLIKQLISNNPEETLNQLPYDVFYNLYFKEKTGIRLGLGVDNSTSKVNIEGQPEPRTTRVKALDLRLGVSYNFVRSNRLTLNAFGDVLYAKQETNTVFTHTLIENFGDPVETIETTTSDLAKGYGGQVGVGVKYSVLKNLAFYIEVPLSFTTTKTESTVIHRQPFTQENKSKTESTTSATNVLLPTTIYLVLMF